MKYFGVFVAGMVTGGLAVVFKVGHDLEPLVEAANKSADLSAPPAAAHPWS
jgi:hypothetical protein